MLGCDFFIDIYVSDMCTVNVNDDQWQKTASAMEVTRYLEMEKAISSEHFHCREDVNSEYRKYLVEQIIILHNGKNAKSELSEMFGILFEGEEKVVRKYNEASLFQAVSVMDRYLQVRTVSETTKVYLGVAALYLSSKTQLPLHLLSDENRTNIVRISNEMRSLRLVPSSVEYLRQLFSLIQLEQHDFVFKISKFILTITLRDPVATHYYPSELASTAMMMAAHMLGLNLPEDVMACTGYTSNSLRRVQLDCARIIRDYSNDECRYLDQNTEETVAAMVTEGYLINLLPQNQ